MLKVALIGCGRIAEKHLKALRFQEKKARAQLLAVVDSNPDLARKRLSEYCGGYFSQLPVYSSSAELYEREEVEAVAITTPSGSHYALAKEAMDAGCHLLIEKPMAMWAEEARELAEIAKAKNSIIALGHIYRYFPAVQELAEDIKTGRFGRVYYGTVTVRWGHDQDYYDSAPWRGTWAADGGVVMNQSVHALDLMQWLLQAEGLMGVKASCARQSHEMEAEDLGLALFEFSNDIFLNYEGTTSTDPQAKEAAFFIACEKADIRAQLFGKKLRFSVKEKGEKELRWQYIWRWLKNAYQRDGLGAIVAAGRPHQAIYSDWLTAINEARKPVADAEAGVRSLEMVEALYEDAGVDRPSKKE